MVATPRYLSRGVLADKAGLGIGDGRQTAHHIRVNPITATSMAAAIRKQNMLTTSASSTAGTPESERIM